MARTGSLLVLLMLVVSVEAAAQTNGGFQASVIRRLNNGIEITKTEIASGIYQFTVKSDGYVEELNSVAIVNDADVVVYDTYTRPSCARVVVEELQKITNKPVRYVVNSHWHPDHWSGNEVYARAFPGLEIVASEEVARHMRNAAPAWPARFANILKQQKAQFATASTSGKNSDGTPFTIEDRRKTTAEINLYEDFASEAKLVNRTYPTMTYQKTLTLRHGGREFRFLTLTGDSEDTTVLYLEKEKILITGDVVVHPIPYGTPSLSHRMRDLKLILNDMAVDVIIPGHGPAMREKSYLTLELQLLESVTSQVERALQNGAADLKQVQDAVDVRAFAQRFSKDDPDLKQRFEGLTNGLIRRAIREAREQDYQQ